MGYQTFAHAGKELIKSEDIGPGQIDIRHLSPALYTEFRMIGLHNHSGVGSVKIDLSFTQGFFPLAGFKMVSSDGKKWIVTVNTSGTLVVTQIT